MAYCVNCGFKIDLKWKFCPKCGNPNILLDPKYADIVKELEEKEKKDE